MNPYVTYCGVRQEVWKGHDTEEGVRRAIAYARQRGAELRVFATVDLGPGQAEFVEFASHDWDETFF